MTSPSLPPIGQIVQKYKLRADKKFGQHYLYDLNLTAKIVRLSGVTADDLVFEIGPGPGGLTRSLLLSGARVHVIETDQRFLPHMAELRAAFDNRITVHVGDALTYDLDALAQGKPYHVVANLPYNVGTALLINWLTASNPNWKSLTLMFQLEVANRIVAGAGNAHFGRLSILCASVARSEILMRIPAKAFTPPPKVESAVVHITPLPLEDRFDDLEGLAKLTGLAFGQKRKMLRASLKPLAAQWEISISDWLANQGIEPTARPETLTPEQFMRMTSSLREFDSENTSSQTAHQSNGKER